MFRHLEDNKPRHDGSLVIPAFQRGKQEDPECKVTLDHVASWILSWPTSEDPISKTQNKSREETAIFPDVTLKALKFQGPTFLSPFRNPRV